MSEVLHCQAVERSFVEGNIQVTVLKDLDFSLQAGERVAIVGSSGSGKSTLLQLLGGLDNPTQGKIQLLGQDFQNMSQAERGHWRNQHLGFIYQFHHLLNEFSALENVSMPLLIRGDKPAKAQARAKALLEEVGLGERLSHKPGELSGGERQRAAVARALVTKPACILADEPTGNLDQQTANQVYNTMLELNQLNNTALVMVTHDLKLAEKMDKIFRLEKGALVTL